MQYDTKYYVHFGVVVYTGGRHSRLFGRRLSWQCVIICFYLFNDIDEHFKPSTNYTRVVLSRAITGAVGSVDRRGPQIFTDSRDPDVYNVER